MSDAATASQSQSLSQRIDEHPQPPPGAPVSTPTFVYVLLLLVVILIVVIIVIAMVLRDPAFHCPSKSAKSNFNVRPFVPINNGKTTTTRTTPVVPMIPDHISYRNTFVAPRNLLNDKKAEDDKEEEDEETEDENESTSLISIRSVELFDAEQRVIIVGHGFVDKMVILWDNRIQYPYTKISSDVIWIDRSHRPLAMFTKLKDGSGKTVRIGPSECPNTTLYAGWKSNATRNLLRCIRPGSDSCLFSDSAHHARAFLSFTIPTRTTTTKMQENACFHVMIRRRGTSKLLSQSEFNSLSIRLSQRDRAATKTNEQIAPIHAGIASFRCPSPSPSSGSGSENTNYFHAEMTTVTGLHDIFSYRFYSS